MKIKQEKEFKRQIIGTLEDYGLLQKYKFNEWNKEVLNNFINDIMIIMKRFERK